jgi:hypothetical protein
MPPPTLPPTLTSSTSPQTISLPIAKPKPPQASSSGFVGNKKTHASGRAKSGGKCTADAGVRHGGGGSGGGVNGSETTRARLAPCEQMAGMDPDEVGPVLLPGHCPNGDGWYANTPPERTSSATEPLFFEDYPEFTPNLSPKQMLQVGVCVHRTVGVGYACIGTPCVVYCGN